jgi:hypothetical protein
MNTPHTRAGPWTGVIAAIALASSLALAVAIWKWPPSPTPLLPPSLPIVFQTPGGLLEVAGIQATEYFQQTSITSIAGIVIGRTVTQVQVPVTYRYRIELAKVWKAFMRDGRFLVIAPVVKPGLPVGMDTSRMRVLTTSGWLAPSAHANLTALLQRMSQELATKASSSGYIDQQREVARKTVTEFVAKWLITQERWKSVKPEQISVYFADEPIGRLRSFGPEFAGSI